MVCALTCFFVFLFCFVQEGSTLKSTEEVVEVTTAEREREFVHHPVYVR